MHSLPMLLCIPCAEVHEMGLVDSAYEDRYIDPETSLTVIVSPFRNCLVITMAKSDP